MVNVLVKKGSYLETCHSDFWKKVFEKELEYLLKKLKGYKRILSVGCGPAIIERGLQENGFEVTGLDVSKEALEGSPDSMRTVIGNAEEMDFPDSSFDAAIYVASIQFIADYVRAIEETARILRRDGKLIAMLLNPESEFFRQKSKDKDSYVNMIKHVSLARIKSDIGKRFSTREEYYLGIRGKEIFKSKNPGSAGLYIIEGVRK